MKEIIDKLEIEHNLSRDEWINIISHITDEEQEYLFEKARTIRIENYGHDVYIRGLIEFTNYCKNNCYYCGLQRDNTKVERYRLDKLEIVKCCEAGYKLGFRTFVLQGGEDPYFTDSIMVDIVSTIKALVPDCAVTLSVGEKSYESYKRLYEAGADRYLLRHETSNEIHYGMLHPKELTIKNRKECLYNLKKIGFQTGAGFMVGSPYQTIENLAEDMMFLSEFKPEMVGIGPFIPHHNTRFKDEKSGELNMTLRMLALTRVMLPNVLLPATTALSTIDTKGREQGILVGANVVMPNLSPMDNRNNYSLYDKKICTGEEAAEGLLKLKQQISKIGYDIVIDKGDYKKM